MESLAKGDLYNWFQSEEFSSLARKYYKKADVDNSGILEIEEISAIINQLLNKLGVQAISLKKIKNIIQSYDMNGDGKINFPEFKEIFKELYEFAYELQEEQQAPKGYYTTQNDKTDEISSSEASDYINMVSNREIQQAAGFEDENYVKILWQSLIDIYKNVKGQQRNVQYILVGYGQEVTPYYNLTIKGGTGKIFRSKYRINQRGVFRMDNNDKWAMILDLSVKAIKIVKLGMTAASLISC